MTIRRHRRRLPLAALGRMRGLRARLVFAFVLVALLSGAAASIASYWQGRTAVLAGAQDTAMNRTRDELTTASRQMAYPPTREDLTQLVAELSGDVLAVYRDLEVPRAEPGPDIPPGLRAAVRAGNGMHYQRLDVEGAPFLVYGTTVIDQFDRPTGIEVYAQTDLRVPEQNIQKLASWAAGFTALSLGPAILLALLAAQGLLRPVRSLGQAARQLAAGQLDTRLRVRGSDELADLVLTFNNTAADLEDNVDRLRRMESNARRFVADVSHELRTPLAAMVGVTETLDEESANLPGDAGIAARLISTETRRLAGLVENLVEITRFDAGRAELRLDGDVDLAAAVAATLAARGWADEVVLDVPAGLTAEVDRRRLDVIVANLVSNALRHGTAPVRVSAGTEGIWVRLAVTDHGPGLPPEVASQVFERFYKADTARSRSEGSGLGLAIALENARLHGGSIEAGNAPGGGARFTVTLPRVHAADPAA